MSTETAKYAMQRSALVVTPLTERPSGAPTARRCEPQIVLKAFTLQEHDASTSILQRHGFRVIGDAHDDHAGAVWEWRA